jgi:uncharacterized protein (TIGR02594 family)
MADPTWMVRAHSEMGVAEVEGAGSNPRVMEYFRACGTSADWVKGDDTPWCGGFCGFLMREEGYPLPAEPLRARAWLDWGTRLEQPKPGCVVVISRGSDPKSGHVGLFRQWSDDRSKIYLLGGNQGDAVTIAAFSADRVLGYRWPPGAAASKPIDGRDPVMSEVKSIATVAGAGGSAVTAASAIPTPPTELMAGLGAWKDMAAQIGDLVAFSGSNWMAIGAALALWSGWRLWTVRKEEITSGAIWRG